MIKFTINKNFTENIKNKWLGNVERAVNDVTDKIYLDVILNSPVKTWAYQRSHRNLWTQRQGNMIIWTVENQMQYAEKVETWWRKRAVNWNLVNIWQIYNSVWANVYRKSVQKNEPYFFSYFKRWKL